VPLVDLNDTRVEIGMLIGSLVGATRMTMGTAQSYLRRRGVVDLRISMPDPLTPSAVLTHLVRPKG
jgi:hypothetical protein